MKKLLCLCLCIILALSLALPSAADVIWEPDDDYYFENYDECTLVELEFEAVSDAVIQVSPRDRVSTSYVPAGETVYVYVLWKNYGYIESAYGVGWVDLSYFQQRYQLADFLTDHETEFVVVSGTISRMIYSLIYYWTFPGSGQLAGYISADTFSWTNEDVAYQATWTDENGLLWCYMSYYYGASGWICLSDPGNAYLPVTAPMYKDSGFTSEYFNSYNPTTAVVVCLATAAIVITALVFLSLMLKRKKQNGPE